MGSNADKLNQLPVNEKSIFSSSDKIGSGLYIIRRL